ncbi:DUF21 domain-containing protein [Chitinophaga sp. 180180018-2]|uniref:DUF21 domain-containing protein n=1 Tax=Chitinophaga sp. 180180018-2 TaxID=3108351 RepID=UPI0030CF6D29
MVFLVLLAGFFSGIEAAFANVNKLSIELKKKQGRATGRILANLNENPSRFLATSLVGFTITVVIYGIMVAGVFQTAWESMKPQSDSTGMQPLIIFAEIILASLLMLFLGFFIPRAVFRSRPETLLSFFALPISLVAKPLYVIGNVMASISEWVLKYLFNVRLLENGESFTRVDVEHFIRQSQQHFGENNQELNTELFENALSLAHVKIRGCLIPHSTQGN